MADQKTEDTPVVVDSTVTQENGPASSGTKRSASEAELSVDPPQLARKKSALTLAAVDESSSAPVSDLIPPTEKLTSDTIMSLTAENARLQAEIASMFRIEYTLIYVVKETRIDQFMYDEEYGEEEWMDPDRGRKTSTYYFSDKERCWKFVRSCLRELDDEEHYGEVANDAVETLGFVEIEDRLEIDVSKKEKEDVMVLVFPNGKKEVIIRKDIKLEDDFRPYGDDSEDEGETADKPDTISAAQATKPETLKSLPKEGANVIIID